MTQDLDPLIQQAAQFAKTAHESIDQRRKYSGLPYIVHPEAVANMVATVTKDPTILAAAWLHDVVEDTPVTLDQVKTEFGEDVALLVENLTDVSKPSDGNREARIAIDRGHTSTADPRAKTVKLADVIHNCSDIAVQDPGFARRYLPEKERLLTVLSEGHTELYHRARKLIAELKEKVAN